MCVCSFRYPACNVHAPYCYLRPVRLYSIFPHYFIKGTMFEKKSLNTKCLFWFSLHLFLTFLSLRSTEREREIWSKMYISLHVQYPLFLSDFNETWIFSTDFRNIHIKFHETPYSGGRVVPCGQTDWHDEVNSSFSQFCERSWNLLASQFLYRTNPAYPRRS